MISQFSATPEEVSKLQRVRRSLQQAIESGQTVRLPQWCASSGAQASDVALLTVGLEENEYGGSVGGFRYQFEGEEDLLHLFIVRQDLTEFSFEQAQAVVRWILPDVPVSFIYVKPGARSHHFYFGHDWLIASSSAS